MDFWPEFLASSWGKEFVAGGFGGMAGIVSGYPLDTLRIRQQQRPNGSAVSIFRSLVASEGLAGLYGGMAAPLASVAFQAVQNAMVFQIYAVLSRAVDKPCSAEEPPTLRGVAVGGMGTGAVGSVMLTPVELVKIRLQAEGKKAGQRGPASVVKSILKREGVAGMFRGLRITLLRDAPAHGVYFWTYEYVREALHPGCRRSGDESLRTMLVSGGLAGVASWGCCYPLDVLKTRLQADRQGAYLGILDCFRKSVQRDGYSVLSRGLPTALSRAFLVNGAIFAAYEISLRFILNGYQ